MLLHLSSFLCSAQCDCLQVLHHRSARSRLLILPSGLVAVEIQNKAGAEFRLGQLFLIVTIHQTGAESSVCTNAD